MDILKDPVRSLKGLKDDRHEAFGVRRARITAVLSHNPAVIGDGDPFNHG
jgi:hypothetical protein